MAPARRLFQFFVLTAPGDRLAAAGAQWQNHYLDSDTWPALKSSGLAPFGQLPILEVRRGDGATYVLAESHAIVRHVAREFGFGE